MSKSVEEQIEDAVYTLMSNAFDSGENNVSVVPFVAQTDVEEEEVSYPAVQFAADPLMPAKPGAVLSTVELRLQVRTDADDDPSRSVLEDIWQAASALITADNIGPLVMEPWIVCGVDDTEDGGINVDPEKKTQDKGKAYRIAVADTTE